MLTKELIICNLKNNIFFWKIVELRKMSKNSNHSKIQILVVFNNKLIYSSYVD